MAGEYMILKNLIESYPLELSEGLEFIMVKTSYYKDTYINSLILNCTHLRGTEHGTMQS